MSVEAWVNNSDNNTVDEFLISQWDYSNNNVKKIYSIGSFKIQAVVSDTGGGSNTSQVNTTKVYGLLYLDTYN